jgi:hypothetical protein
MNLCLFPGFSWFLSVLAFWLSHATAFLMGSPARESVLPVNIDIKGSSV